MVVELKKYLFFRNKIAFNDFGNTHFNNFKSYWNLLKPFRFKYLENVFKVQPSLAIYYNGFGAVSEWSKFPWPVTSIHSLTNSLVKNHLP